MKVIDSDMHSKAYSYHMKVRASFKKQSTEALRKQIMKTLDNHINQTISESNMKLSQENLKSLISYANNDVQNAIIQLGNLIIDNKQIVDHLKNKLIFGKNDYWSWLIRIMIVSSPNVAEYGYEWIIKNFLNKNISLLMKSNLMESLVQMSLIENIAASLAKDYSFLEQLYRTIKSNSEVTSKLGFTILCNLVSINNQITFDIISVYKNKLNQIIRLGFLKSQESIREQTCAMISNLVLDGFLPSAQIMKTIFVKSVKQKDSIVEQLSYFFLNVSKNLSLELVEQIASNGMLNTIHYYLKSESDVLIDNGIDIIKNILKRLNNDIRGYKAFYGVLESNGTIQLIQENIFVEGIHFGNIQEYLLG